MPTAMAMVASASPEPSATAPAVTSVKPPTEGLDHLRKIGITAAPHRNEGRYFGSYFKRERLEFLRSFDDVRSQRSKACKNHGKTVQWAGDAEEWIDYDSCDSKPGDAKRFPLEKPRSMGLV